MVIEPLPSLPVSSAFLRVLCGKKHRLYSTRVPGFESCPFAKSLSRQVKIVGSLPVSRCPHVRLSVRVWYDFSVRCDNGLLRGAGEEDRGLGREDLSLTIG